MTGRVYVHLTTGIRLEYVTENLWTGNPVLRVPGSPLHIEVSAKTLATAFRLEDDDVMALADAVGVTADTTSVVDEPIPYTLPGVQPACEFKVAPFHPAWSIVLSDAYLAAMVWVWSKDYHHAPCDGPDCDRAVCTCPTGLCPGHADLACGHHNVLCDQCRPVCPDCRQDARDDAGSDR